MVVKLSDFLSTSFSTFSANDTNNTGVTYPGAVVHTTTLTPGVGIGAGIDFQVETTNNNNETGMRLETVTTDVTAGSEDFDLVVKLMQNGAAANEKFRVSSNGAMYAATSANVASALLANSIGIYPTSNSSGQNLGSNTARFQLTANAGNFTGMVTAGAGLYVQGILYANGGVSGSTGAVLLSGGGIGTVEWSTTLSANSTLVQALSVPISASGGFFTGSNMNASVHWAGANVYMNATSIFVSTNSTMNTIISANQITLNGANVMTTATTLKVFNAAGSQVFP